MSSLSPLKVFSPNAPLADNQVILVASGDSRLAANLSGWHDQDQMEQKLAQVFGNMGFELLRGHAIDTEKGHGFLDSQRAGMDAFRHIPANARVVVAEAVWQFSHHVLAGLQFHHGPILTVANWSGAAPGLVGMLNLNGSLTKMGVKYSTLWSQNFDDEFFLTSLKAWLQTGLITHDQSHVRGCDLGQLNPMAVQKGRALAEETLERKAIFGVFDEGCMGMMNAIVDDHMLNKAGIFKERLSQANLFAHMQLVTDAEAQGVYDWLKNEGMFFHLGHDPVTQLTEEHVLEQCKMYIAAVRLAHKYSCDAIGIQYQLGMADTCAASDLVEGMLNNPHRPPVFCSQTGEELYKGEALTHFNEVDEGAGIDGYVTNQVWRQLGYDPSNTLHDLRYGEEYDGEFVWVFLISGAAPASHFEGGYAGARSERQPAMYFQRGGGGMTGVSKPGVIIWSRVFVQDGGLHCDLGIGDARKLPLEETNRRWQMTTPQWPIMHGVLRGVSRDQMMGRHKSNHIQVAYVPDDSGAHQALAAKAAMMAGLGITVHLCGKTD